MTIHFLKEQYLIKKRNAIIRGWIPREYPFYMMGKKDIVFLHIPKTAGTSIRESLLFYPPNGKIMQYDQHHTSKQILYLIGQKKWDQSFKFCFVRNPFDRFLSQHRYFLRKGKLKDQKENDFQFWARKRINIALKFDPLRRQDHHFYPASDWMKNRKGDLLEMDFIGRFENLEEDYQKLIQILNWPADLKTMNIAPQKIDYRKAYDDELIEMTASFFKEDIERFNYTF